jgi:hypothetical protein
MKRIVDGVAYDSDTSERIAVKEYSDLDRNGNVTAEYEDTLWRTRRGAFFVLSQRTWIERVDGEWVDRDRTQVIPHSRGEAENWISVGDVELISENTFEDPPEAADDAEDTEAVIYLRLSVALKAQVESVAASQGLSTNAWAARCLRKAYRMESPDVQGPQDFPGNVGTEGGS